MTLKCCVVCGELAESNRCSEHQLKPSRNFREKGYDAAWDRLSRKARKLQPFCADCGATDNLEADHLPSAWHRREQGLKVRLQDVEVVCGPCNRRRGSARPGSARAEAWGEEVADPLAVSEGKAKFGTHTPGGIR